jgi:branched-chain amino acid transport system substrate-binding protein
VALDRRHALKLLAATALTATAARPGRAAATIKIGDLCSYTTVPAFTIPYRQGWQLALEQINAAGGVNGAMLEVISRDDGGKPGDAVTAANQLVSSDGVVLLMGTFLSNLAIAVADFAKQRNILFVAGEPLTDALTLESGNAQTFRLRAPVSAQVGMLIEQASKLPAKRWATVAPNYEYGQSAVRAFKTLMAAKRPDVEFIAEQWPAFGKLDAAATVGALVQAAPEAIFNVTFGTDLAKFVREGNNAGLFTGRSVVSLLTGEPEYLDPLGEDTPVGWIVTGYPAAQVQTPENQAFLTAYQAKFKELPRLGALVGYTTMKAVAAILARAGSTDTAKLIQAAEGVSFASPVGQITIRKEDHQSTMGVFVGKTDLKDGKGVMVDWRYVAADAYLPSLEEIKKRRP